MTKIIIKIGGISITLLTIFLVGKILIEGIDKHFDNQDTMLCNSAKQSSNVEYLEKCQCYYAGDNIRCIYQ